MNGENKLLVADESVEFEKDHIEVRGFREITSHFRGI